MGAPLAIVIDTGTLHRYPASESCNLDSANARRGLHFTPQMGTDDEVLYNAMRDSLYKRKCKRCFRNGASGK